MEKSRSAAQDESWERYFRAVQMTLPSWSRSAPDRSVFRSNAGGVHEWYAWDRDRDTMKQVTARPGGTVTAALSPDGEWIWWFADTDGDECGVWMRRPFDAGPDEPAAAGLPPSYQTGLALGHDGLAVLGCADRQGSSVHVVRPGAAPREIYRHHEMSTVSCLSYDETLVAITHTEHGNGRHPAVRVLRLDGSPVAELDDNERGSQRLGLRVLGFAPVHGDGRLLLAHQRRGRWEPMLLDVFTGEESDLALGLSGELDAKWYPDGSALLIRRTHRARTQLWSCTPGAAQPQLLDTPPGTISDMTARADGSVEYMWSSAAQPPQLRSSTAHIVLDPSLGRAPRSVPVEDVWVDGPGGRVHALVHRPPGDGPFPTVFELHGGPRMQDSDSFTPRPSAWVQCGYAVVRVNYRGSTGYGREWTDALRHRVGLIELEDVAAVRQSVVASGLADPNRMVLAGGSWGGYLTLLGLGVQPDCWAAGLASLPVADYISAYEDSMEPLRALDRALFGGSPEDVPDRYRASSPLTYVDRVRAPVHILAGLNDPRCPIRQIDNYVAELEKQGKLHQIHRYKAGHGSLLTSDRIQQFRQQLQFLRNHGLH
ncbi:S9 family peptidase [Streptomyces sp. NPDC059696]|uniref:S9 family peptidase n=1 Tax=Streptomyces sp. NPDC059696 TaxID=3346911 RepID=UPI0036971E05